MNPVAKLALRLLRDPKFKALLVSVGPAVATKAADLAKQGRWRQLAILHADSVVDGTLRKVPLGGQPTWVVWSGDSAVGAYPPYTGDLGEAVATVDLDKRQRPDDLPVRSVRRRATERRDQVAELVSRRRGETPAASEVPGTRVRNSPPGLPGDGTSP